MRSLRKAITENVAKEVNNYIIYRHGRPERIVTDNGTRFKSRPFTQLLALFNVQHRTIPIHAPQCNPVERTNRTIKTMIGQYVNQNHQNWNE